jgi:ATP-binding cassette, subfamily B, multidrug efflux pump
VNATLKLFKFLKPYWLWSLLAPLLMILEVAMDLLQPRMVQRIVDDGIAQQDMTIVIQTGIWMVVIAFIGMIGGVGCTVFSVLASQGFGTDLRGSLFRKVQSLSFGNLDRLETGHLITRLTNDIVQVQEMVSMLLRVMVRAPFMLVGSLLMAILTSPQLAVLLLILMPLVIAFLVVVIRKAFPMFSKVQARLDDVNSVMQENLAGVRVVKAFVREDYEIERFGGTNERLMEQTIQAIRTVATAFPALMLIINMGVVAAVWFGGVQVTVGNLATGELIAFVNYLIRSLMSVMFVSMLLIQFSRAQASAARIQEVYDSQPEVQDMPGSLPVFHPRGRVVFENVSFNYKNASNGSELEAAAGQPTAAGNPEGANQAAAPPEESEAVLKGVSFTANPGETVAILGATGSGKSSLVHLIPRFYDVTAGRITVDGVDVRQVDQAALRRNIGIALQESVLFSGTIRENIRYGKQDATEDEIIAAAKAAQAHDFIIEFPESYDTVVGQRGVNLSGGQKQRIAIARALLVRPAILILDDSTSSVDVETEIRIEQALQEIMRDRTSFIIAQRISTVLNADKILVLDNGKLVAEGKHKELLACSPIYREIYDSQLGNGVMASAGA